MACAIPPSRGFIPVAYGPDPSQFGDLYLPDVAGPNPVVVTIHGGFWRSMYGLGEIQDVAAALADAGYAVWNIEYRRIGQPGGGYPGTLEDVARAIDYLGVLGPQYGLNLNQVITVGHSAGGHLALWAAGRPTEVGATGGAGAGRPTEVGATRGAGAKRPTEVGATTGATASVAVRGAVALCGVVDLGEGWRRDLGQGVIGSFIGGSPMERPERYAAASPMAMLPLGVRQALVHGVEDDTVPLALSEGYAAAARAAGDDVMLDALPGMGHFEVVDPLSPAWPHVLAAVEWAFGP
ncbi:MAG: alpha/beta hydrolase [Anaerolineae bacterium]